MTSHDISPVPAPSGAFQPRRPLRLLLSASPGRRAALDGGWWPHSRDIDVELADLVDQFPAAAGRVARALYSRPDWDTKPRSVRVARGTLKTGSFPKDDTHVIELSMSAGTRLRLLVVPPDQPRGRQAMARAADPSNHSSATDVLRAFAGEEEHGEGYDHWTDDGGSFLG